MEFIRTEHAPTPGAYSQGVLVDSRARNLLFLAGQTGNIPGVDGEPVIVGGVEEQTTRALENLLAVVQAAGGGPFSFVSLRVYLKYREDPGADRRAYDAAYRAFFAEHGRTAEDRNMPVREQVWVSEVPWETEGTLIEISAIAAVPR